MAKPKTEKTVELKIAVGMTEDKKSKKWFVDILEYDPILGTATVVERKDCGEHLLSAEDELKKIVAERIFP